jgi:hypothetical protein
MSADQLVRVVEEVLQGLLAEADHAVRLQEARDLPVLGAGDRSLRVADEQRLQFAPVRVAVALVRLPGPTGLRQRAARCVEASGAEVQTRRLARLPQHG